MKRAIKIIIYYFIRSKFRIKKQLKSEYALRIKFDFENLFLLLYYVGHLYNKIHTRLRYFYYTRMKSSQLVAEGVQM